MTDEHAEIRKRLAEDTISFLAKGGIIKPCENGETNKFTDAGFPIPLLKDYTQAQKRNYMKARKRGQKAGGRKAK